MGAKTWFVAWVEPGVDVRELLRSSPKPDAAKALLLVKSLYPRARIQEIRPGNLGEDLSPSEGKAFVGCYPGLTVIAAPELGGDRPSKIDPKFRPKGRARVILHAMHSVVDWFAFAVWEDGALRRALSLSPDNGSIEDLGERFPFERPFWDGAHAIEDYPLPFHPLELGEAAMRALFGFVLEGEIEDGDPEPFDIAMSGFQVS